MKEKITQEQWDKLYKLYEDEEIMEVLFEVKSPEDETVFNHNATSLYNIMDKKGLINTTAKLLEYSLELKSKKSIKEKVEVLEKLFFDAKEDDNILKLLLSLFILNPEDIK